MSDLSQKTCADYPVQSLFLASGLIRYLSQLAAVDCATRATQ